MFQLGKIYLDFQAGVMRMGTFGYTMVYCVSSAVTSLVLVYLSLCIGILIEIKVTLNVFLVSVHYNM